jgi:predicted transcriptional regulator of viral defense system
MNAAGRAWFTLSELSSMLPDLNPRNLCVQVKRMVDKGLLFRVRDGVYYIIPFEQNEDTYMPDWHLLAEPLAGSDCYIGYYSALQIHGLITQPSMKEQIVVPKQKKPPERTVRGVRFQFIYHNEKHYFGFGKQWATQFDRVVCSDLEKTIVDCLYKPEYAGGVVEVARALFASRKQLDFQKLLEYVNRFESQAVRKRLGYLLEMLEIDTPVTEELQRQRSSSISPLDTEAPKDGRVMTRWNIIQNVERETIRGALTT